MADELRLLTKSHSQNSTKIPSFQCIIIILHDLFLICSFIASYPLYSSYFIFFSPYLIRIVSFISPLFIAAVVLSVLLTTAFCPNLPQLELEILRTVVRELKSNLEDVNGDDVECDFEDFEIYRFVFDDTRSIAFRDEDEDEDVDLVVMEKVLEDSSELGMEEKLSLKEKVLEDSIHGGRRNDIPISELEMDEFEEESSLVKLISRRPEENVEVLEGSIHGGRRNDIPISDEFEEECSLVKLTSRWPEEKPSLKEKVLEDSVHGGRRNDIPISEPENLGDGGGRRNDTTISELHRDTFEEKSCSVKFTSRLPEKPVHGSRRNDLTVSDFEDVKSQEETDLLKLFEELDRFEEFSTAIETGSDSDKVVGGLRKAEPDFRTGSDVIDSNEMIKMGGNVSGESGIKVVRSSSWRSNSSSTYGSHGSMSDEKEWRRTLACKLFEERHNSRGGEEGMDSLWEAYEIDNSKKNRKDAMVIGNDGGIEYDEDDGDEDEDEDEEMSNGGLCCLQALKLSTGKMNLGMKKPNLLKISKALKGFRWLHHAKIKHHHGKKS
ncbi:hypothetical protein OSB04_023240 [Centaurea solstitialis]|uniref:Transmembrane protein n=1 Tax=Centaurea solstitialis TaxID=347529 RepID=A0AA38T3G7_9ASTR|nr:hypothetical protein OSB04_023240 [Centaurea solstitialis]